MLKVRDKGAQGSGDRFTGERTLVSHFQREGKCVGDVPSPALVGPVGPYSLRTGLPCLDPSGRCDSTPLKKSQPRCNRTKAPLIAHHPESAGEPLAE